jgi:hypothetical protein
MVFLIIFNIGLLQHRRPLRTLRGTTTIHHGLQHHPPLNRKLIVKQTLPNLIPPQHPSVFGKEAEMTTHIDAEERNVVDGQVAGSTKNSAVAS